jgi:hypothetical protein
VIGLIVGLAVSAFMYAIFIYPKTKFPNNQVQVSGSVSETQSGIITFSSVDSYSSNSITNGSYNLLLTGGETYNVTIENNGGVNFGNYSLYVPINVGNFTANF